MADRRLKVNLSDSSVLDTEFSSVKDRFDQEMKRMENEMNNFRSQLIQRQNNFFNNSSSFLTDDLLSSSSTNSSSFKSSTQQQHQNLSSGPVNPLEGLSSPLIQEDGTDGGKSLKLRFDVSQYAPEEIVLKTVDNKLLVHAKHEEKTDTRSVYREYNREFLLPNGVNPELIRSSLSKDGVLTVEAPLPQAAITGPK